MKIRLREVVIAILMIVAVFAAILHFGTGALKAEGGMAVLWWFASVVLIVLSFIVWLAGLKGKEAVLSIGKRTVAESKESKTWTKDRLVNMFSIVIGIAGILVGLTIILLIVAL